MRGSKTCGRPRAREPQSFGRRVRVASLFLFLASTAHAGPHLEVHGASHFEASTKSRGDVVSLSGALLDDTARALGSERITVRITGGGRVVQAVPCQDGLVAALPDGASSVVTERDGTFCMRFTVDRSWNGARAMLDWPGTKLLAGTRAELAIDPSRATVELRFDPDSREPRVIGLDDGPALVVVNATLPDEKGDDASGMALRLTDEHDALLAAATTVKGVARFVIPEDRLGAVGPGELRVVFDGDARRAKASTVAACDRRVRVVATPHDGILRAEESEDTVAVDLDVTTARGAPVPAGSVEGLVDGAVAGASPVKDGRALLTVHWPREPGDPHLVARYVPDSPSYVATPPTPLPLKVHRALAWKRAAVLLVGAAVLAWFSLARSRFLVPSPRKTLAPVASRGGTAGIEVVAHHQDGRTAWEGRVVDVYDGGAVAAAEVVLERAGFTSLETVARTVSDREGRFVLEGASALPGDQISAEGPFHARVTRPAPKAGVIDIALVSRRRALVQRLVEWASRRGHPFDRSPETTPGHVRRAAADDAPVASWAHAVEQAAFAGGAVDRPLEAEIDRLGHEAEAPRGGGPH